MTPKEARDRAQIVWLAKPYQLAARGPYILGFTLDAKNAIREEALKRGNGARRDA